MQLDMIEPAAPEQAPPLALLPPPERAALALNTAETEAKLRAAAAKHKGITEIKDRAGREQAHGAAMELMRLRTSIGSKADEVRDDAKKFNAAVLAEEKRLVTIVEPEEKRLKALRDGWDEAERKRKEEAERLDRERKLAIAERIAKIKGYRELAQQCRTSAKVQELIDNLKALWEGYDLPAVFEEFADDAGVAYRVTLTHMEGTLKLKVEAEAEAARIKAERDAEAERQRQERERLAEERRQQEAEAARLAAELEAFQRERAAFLAQQQAATEAAKPAEPAAAPQEATAVETMVDLGGMAEAAPAVVAPRSPIRVVMRTNFVKPQEAEQVATLQAGAVIGAPESEDAEVIAGFDEAMTAPVPVAKRPEEAPSAEHLVTVIAQHYDIPASLAIDWLVTRADDILNLDH